MINVNLDDEFLELFYNITNEKPPKDIDLLALKQQLIGVVDLIVELNGNAKKPVYSKALNPDMNEEEFISNTPAILVIDDLGVITYQLKVLLSGFEYEIDCSQEIYDAVNKFKKRKYKYVVMDLFIPTEREGFILLTELKKMASIYKMDTVIGIITASPRKEIEQQCKQLGADFFLEKSNNWQSKLTNIMSKYIVTQDDEDEDWF